VHPCLTRFRDHRLSGYVMGASVLACYALTPWVPTAWGRITGSLDTPTGMLLDACVIPFFAVGVARVLIWMTSESFAKWHPRISSVARSRFVRTSARLGYCALLIQSVPLAFAHSPGQFGFPGLGKLLKPNTNSPYKAFAHFLGTSAAILVSVSAAAMLLHSWVEKPALKMRRCFLSSWKKAIAPAR